MIRRALAWLRAHPLVWLIPLAFWTALFLFVLLKLSTAPETEFIYDV